MMTKRFSKKVSRMIKDMIENILGRETVLIDREVFQQSKIANYENIVREALQHKQTHEKHIELNSNKQ